MGTPIKTSISIPKTLFDQAEILAQRLNLSRDQLFELVLENFIQHHPLNQDQHDSDKPLTEERLIHQGDIYWVQLDDPRASEPGIPHPHVVIQADVLNHSRIHTVVVCALTSNIRRVNLPGNVLLEAGEANLTRPSVVETSKVSTIAKTQLGGYIGTLNDQRINQILDGMRFLQTSFFNR